jgi:hypothetical protein
MRNASLLLIFFVFCSLVCGQERLQEEVSVTNIEVPVRVYFKGEPVPDLKKSDFLLYEGGKLLKINGFNMLRRKIQVADVHLQANVQQTVYKPRLFVLIFNFTDIHLDIKKGIKYLFEKVLRQGDRIMVLANNTFLPEWAIIDLKKEEEALLALLKKDSRKAQLLLQRYTSHVETLINSYKSHLKMGRCLHGPVTANMECARLFREFLEKYILVYKDYKRKFLIPDVDRYYNFSKYLEKVKIDKWVINFYQYERFLNLKMEGQFMRRIDAYVDALLSDATGMENKSLYGRLLRKALLNLQMEMNVADDFPVDQISKLFMKVNATFHTIFMRSLTPSTLRDFDYKNVSTDIENSLRGITKQTGGELIGSNNLEKSLEKISTKEDVIYVLTYEPQGSSDSRKKIKIKMKNKGFKAVYDNNVYALFFSEYLDKKEQEIPEIKLKDFNFKEKAISFKVVDFKRAKTGDEESGKVKIRIRVSDEKNTSLYDQEKSLTIKKTELNLTIGFEWLHKGEYNVLIDYTDLLGGKKDRFFKAITVPR